MEIYAVISFSILLICALAKTMRKPVSYNPSPARTNIAQRAPGTLYSK